MLGVPVHYGAESTANAHALIYANAVEMNRSNTIAQLALFINLLGDGRTKTCRLDYVWCVDNSQIPPSE